MLVPCEGERRWKGEGGEGGEGERKKGCPGPDGERKGGRLKEGTD